ncbi:U8 snoRNA-decapping enzyme isoform X1 [Paramormyrops kingsleyae]|uniref:U8 snoRNA-decapping enzyme n=2 Tax=Paramormyrops kingsleyae TaxID=1676925 RepID=A0A3B3QTJ9_9TELE|nr:U8 snoRNA-decapping enzyme-like isoform X1 [Paramormyrops kingsleyae]
MESKEITKEQALSLKGYKHACHIMLYGDTDAKLFGKIPTKHIVLMQMRFDGLLGFPGGLVNPGQESLESGLSREIGEELGVALCVSPEDHLSTQLASSPPNLVCHFFVKKMTEEELREVEKAAVVASDHGLEVMGLVRVPLFTLRNGGGLSSFLSHSFIGNSRSQLLSALRTLGLVSHHDLEAAVTRADKSLHSKAR